MNTLFLLLAQAAGATAEATPGTPTAGPPPAQGPMAACGGGGSMQSLIFMGLMFVVFWFILIRPQQKRAKEHAALLTALKKGDVVITRGGIIGKVSGVADNVVTLELQEKVRVRVMKSYIEGKHSDTSSVSSKEGSSAVAESKN